MKQLIFFAALTLIFLPGPALAQSADLCGAHSYLDSVEYKNGKEIIICSCAPGYSRTEATCERDIPDIMFEDAAQFVPNEVTGEARAYLRYKGQRKEVPTERIFYANLVATDKNAGLSAYVAAHTRFDLTARSRLELTKAPGGENLAITAFSGLMRLNQHLPELEKLALKNRYQRAGAYIKQAPDSPFTLWLPGGKITAQDPDMLIEGKDNGDIMVYVLEGRVTIADHNGTAMARLEAGNVGIMRKGTPARLLRHNQQDAIQKLWRERTAQD